MDLKPLIAAAVLSVQESPVEPEQPRIRFRGNRVINTNKHDARCEAVEHVANFLKQNKVPVWAAIPLAYKFVDSLPEDIPTSYIPFDPDSYEVIEHGPFYKRLNEEMLKFLHRIVTGSDGVLPEMPEQWDRFSYSVYENKNHKKEMEDKKLIYPVLSVVEPSKEHTLKKASLFGVFDGHGGQDCANYAVAHMPRCLLETQIEDSTKILAEALRNLDKQLLVRCEKEKIAGGSTGVVVLIQDDIIDIAWIGDSAIGALTDDKITTLTIPHNPQDPKEVERVEREGGMIMNVFGEDRVNGVLNITRALGDYQAKPLISGEPGDARYSIKNDGFHMLFLASDGVWDCLSEDEIYKIVTSFIKTNPEAEHSKLAQTIGNAARVTSTDNLMIIVVFLKPPSEIWKIFSA